MLLLWKNQYAESETQSINSLMTALWTKIGFFRS